MPIIPTPTVPSATTTVSAVQLKPTQSNNQFYIYSGEITVDTNETTMVSINDIGKRDVLLCFTLGWQGDTNSNYTIKVKSNGANIFVNELENSSSADNYGRDYKFILPANTNLEITLEMDVGSYAFTVASYGYYL